MRLALIIILSIILTIILACDLASLRKKGQSAVTADTETAAMPDTGDAADDPAIWVCRADPSRSLIIGTNKRKGIYVYTLDGKESGHFDAGRINNIDIRYGFSLGTRKVDLLGGSNRTDNTLLFMAIDPSTGKIEPIPGGSLPSKLPEVYGFCLYRDPGTGMFYCFVNGKDGTLEQWELTAPGGMLKGRLVRTLSLGSQPEGMVADDERGLLYIGEEDRGIWKFRASPDAGAEGTLVDTVGSGHLVADVEGLAIFRTSRKSGYLIASSQGNNSFAVYRREGGNDFLGTFKISEGSVADSVSDTDGIEVCNASLGPLFPSGLFVAQDGENRNDTLLLPQNFKLVSWEKIARSFDPPLSIDTTPRLP